MGILEKLFHKRFTEKLYDSVELVKLGVLNRLAEKYKGIYEHETADLLASAVVRELFYEKPTDPVASDFFSTNKHLIDKEMVNLQYDDQVCKVVTQALRIKSSLIRQQPGDAAKSLDEHIEELTGLGIFQTDVYSPAPNIFHQIAANFYEGQ
jgi:hypothetical protein